MKKCASQKMSKYVLVFKKLTRYEKVCQKLRCKYAKAFLVALNQFFVMTCSTIVFFC